MVDTNPRDMQLNNIFKYLQTPMDFNLELNQKSPSPIINESNLEYLTVENCSSNETTGSAMRIPTCHRQPP